MLVNRTKPWSPPVATQQHSCLFGLKAICNQHTKVIYIVAYSNQA